MMGSLKFTKGFQEANAENVLITHDTVLARPHTQHWQMLAKHTQPYVGRGVRQ